MALGNAKLEEVLSRLRYWDYFRLLGRPSPEVPELIIEALIADDLVQAVGEERYAVTNLGAMLFAVDIYDFEHLRRKAVRVIQYSGNSRVKTVMEQEGRLGYASGLQGLVRFVSERLPQAEQISGALRKSRTLYPEVAVREIVANALIHQDFDAIGAGPMVEIFEDRVEVTNPGTPLIDIQRLLDLPPKSRNDSLARLMRHLGICEERGSGIDKVLTAIEASQLPPPDFLIAGENTKVVLLAPRPFREMTKAEKVRACYQHAGLMALQRTPITNESLRTRFKAKDRGTVSRVIGDTLQAGLIKHYDPENQSRRYAKYVPFWA